MSQLFKKLRFRDYVSVLQLGTFVIFMLSQVIISVSPCEYSKHVMAVRYNYVMKKAFCIFCFKTQNNTALKGRLK